MADILQCQLMDSLLNHQVTPSRLCHSSFSPSFASKPMLTKNQHLEQCENDPIHVIGQIQSFGLLLVVERETLRLVQVSSNTVPFTGLTPKDLVGQHISACGIEGIEHAITQLKRPDRKTWLPPHVTLHGQTHNLIAHDWRHFLVLEFEPHDELVSCDLSPAIDHLLQTESYENLLRNTVREIQRIAGYDRTMIYRFHEDWHGEVVAEAHNGKTGPSYLGLHYPASDIPQLARRLFTINPIRIIADVQAEPVPLYPARAANAGEPTDLSHSVLRAASPVHIQYLKNMGVAASMTISLMAEGKLWGLIACHHDSNKWVNYQARQACRRVGELFSNALQLHLARARHERMSRTSEIGSQLARYSLSGSDLTSSLSSHAHTVLDLVECGGAAICLEGRCKTLGATPSAGELSNLIGWLTEHQREDVFVTNELSTHYPEAEAIKNTAAGLVSAAIAPERGEFILWFKPEVVSTVYWGGNPEHPAEMHQTENGTEISPRRSFDKWAKLMERQSRPWRDPDIGSIHRLRDDVLHVLVKKSLEVKHLHEELEEAYRQLDTFSYTVSHDLRTPLNAVRVYAEILRDELGSAGGNTRQISTTDKIMRNADRMSNLMNAVLDYSRARKAETRFSRVEVEPLVQPILDDLRTAYHGHPIEFHIHELPPAYGDATMVSQVFSNLLSNAVKYSRNREKSVVCLSGELNNDGAVYSVRDNGIGIAKEKVDQVFQLFSRLCTDSEYEGHGVGMSIVKRIMERHNGKIWFESLPGSGSTFHVLFPHAQL